MIIVLLFLIITALLIIKVALRMCVGKCVSKMCLVGKVIIVTGSNSGIGYHTARDLASRGGRVILACRNESRGTAARDKIISETGNNEVIYKHLDLSSLASVRRFANDIIATEKQLDVLVNNAGVVGYSACFTSDGIVESMQVNYFGPFLLTLLLMPLLKTSQPSRIINVSSLLYYFGSVNFTNINGFHTDFIAYCNSKLCELLFTVELSKRLKGTGVVVNGCHPGILHTNLTSNVNFFMTCIFWVFCWLCTRSAEEAAQTLIHLSVSKECENVSGKFFYDCKERFMLSGASDAKLGYKLWKYSMKLVKYKDDMWLDG